MRWIAALAILTMALGPAAAHQQKVAQTDIWLNKRTGLVEIIHRFSLHDAEDALSDAEGHRINLVFDKKAQTRFAGYVARTFSIALAGETDPLPLALIGSEAERGYIWVYQEMVMPDKPGDWLIRSDTFRHAWDDQVNRVNVRVNGHVRTLVFDGADHELSVEIDMGDSQRAAL